MSSWAEIRPWGNRNGAWLFCGSSFDGTVLAVGQDSNGFGYLSTDSGSTWNEILPLDAGNSMPFAVSANGQVILVQDQNVGATSLYISTNSGASWGQTPTMPTSCYPVAACTSSDGDIIYVSGYTTSGAIFKSADGGATFTTIQTLAAPNRADVACNSSGSILYVLWSADPGSIYKSTDSGTTFSHITIDGSQSGTWNTVACSADGTVVLVGGVSTGLYLSTNSGGSWTHFPTVSGNVKNVSVSMDGGTLMAAQASSPGLYVSTNAGSSWSTPLSGIVSRCDSCASSNGGGVSLAGAVSGRLYMDNTQGFNASFQPMAVTGSVPGSLGLVEFSASLPPLSVTATMGTMAGIKVPALEFQGGMLCGQLIGASVSLPAEELQAQTGWRANPNLIAEEVSGGILCGAVFTGEGTGHPETVYAHMLAGAVMSVSVSFQGETLSGDIRGPWDGEMDSVLPSFAVYASLSGSERFDDYILRFRRFDSSRQDLS